MIPVLCVVIPGIGEVRYDRHGYRTFRPVKAKADLVFERVRAIESALVTGCGRRDPSPGDQVDVLLAAYPGSSVHVLTHEWSEAPETAVDRAPEKPPARARDRKPRGSTAAPSRARGIVAARRKPTAAQKFRVRPE